ncbi:MAG TPA: thymidine kinase [Spirochaetales bacterium]|nr:thymidine kinase [Spirochaetales bacterium]HOT58030.1 thymidine kinase [Spirochaetales bacterium]HPD80116.1 thymidine kinase [Spirochaetales bacterium]HQG40583.1 thymidine kinase [Spirochaetales bacterium]HQK33770.1 thymidine kinase [Spirochaetales bacterium]
MIFSNKHADSTSERFLMSLGFPALEVHSSLNHFDFTRAGRRIIVIGPMGSGKTEFAARVWKDARVALQKSPRIAETTTTQGADRRIVHFIRSQHDTIRFPDYPEDALAYRGGYVRCGENITIANSSFGIENALAMHPQSGTFIIDEAAFYDERLAYLIRQESEQRGITFILPTLVLNFRKEIFNNTVRLLLENATDVFPLTAYCEHPDCIRDSLYTYRYYKIDGQECPALYFDPLIIIGGDTIKDDPMEPNYCTRCEKHHYLPGKEYTYFTLKPLGEKAAQGNIQPLLAELSALNGNIEDSRLYTSIQRCYINVPEPVPETINALKVPCIAERALIYLYAEQNMLSLDQVREIIQLLNLNRDYIMKRCADNQRPLEL